MRNVLALTAASEDATIEEVNQLIDEMNEIIRAQFTDGEIDYLKSLSPSFNQTDRFVTLSVLEQATGHSAEHISSMRNGNLDLRPSFVRELRYVHQQVRERPFLCRKAIEDWVQRKTGSDTMFSETQPFS